MQNPLLKKKIKKLQRPLITKGGIFFYEECYECGLPGFSWTIPEFARACKLHDQMYVEHRDHPGSTLQRKVIDRQFLNNMLRAAELASPSRQRFLKVMAYIFYGIVRSPVGAVVWALHYLNWRKLRNGKDS